MQLALMESGSVILDIIGHGTISFTPRRVGEKWLVQRMSTYGDSDPEPQLWAYRGYESPIQLVDTSQSANSDISDGNQIQITSPGRLLVVYRNGQSGARMSYRIEGILSRGI